MDYNLSKRKEGKITVNKDSTIENRKTDYLAQFMNLHWLRPETALWRTLDCMVLQDIEFFPPIIDVGCGDGLFSFTRGGGGTFTGI